MEETYHKKPLSQLHLKLGEKAKTAALCSEQHSICLNCGIHYSSKTFVVCIVNSKPYNQSL